MPEDWPDESCNGTLPIRPTLTGSRHRLHTGHRPRRKGTIMQTAAILSDETGKLIRGELIERRKDGTATILFAGSLKRTGREVTIEDLMARAPS
ncbi:hypothetical protein FEV53_18130 [Palleronia caenipelagi]|uniref:Uncharacterized protein n=2 Tax=Palleronia caenipelagi TaxID=2489174 RepID=A0A547PL96_9RHOB|nr:hypothetical protein FEV53_18130 [Palleronia caenipelagi]